MVGQCVFPGQPYLYFGEVQIISACVFFVQNSEKIPSDCLYLSCRKVYKYPSDSDLVISKLVGYHQTVY